MLLSLGVRRDYGSRFRKEFGNRDELSRVQGVIIYGEKALYK